jgi:beta-carotene 3-hydroxylase
MSDSSVLSLSLVRRQQITYQVSAIAATTGVSALAVLATYYKFSLMTAPDSPFPWLDMGGTLALVIGGVAGMEMWARWAHKVLWHDFQPGWSLHKSHHEPRIGPFEVCWHCRDHLRHTHHLCWQSAVS